MSDDTQALTVGRSAAAVKGQGHQIRAKSTVKGNPQSKSTELSLLSHRSKVEKDA